MENDNDFDLAPHGLTEAEKRFLTRRKKENILADSMAFLFFLIVMLALGSALSLTEV